MDTNKCCDLLFVRYDEKLYAVEAPAYEAEVGDLVEFAPGPALVRGEVKDKMFCAKGEAEYRCIGMMNPIHPARRIYKVRWEAWEGNDEECGC